VVDGGFAGRLQQLVVAAVGVAEVDGPEPRQQLGRRRARRHPGLLEAQVRGTHVGHGDADVEGAGRVGTQRPRLAAVRGLEQEEARMPDTGDDRTGAAGLARPHGAERALLEVERAREIRHAKLDVAQRAGIGLLLHAFHGRRR
jgi:hypothetical protein